MNWLKRTELLLKTDKLKRLTKANILIVGLGGVGSYAAEFLARTGVGKMTIVDGDKIDTSNINRQLLALHSTTGQLKTETMANRLRDINPDLQLNLISEFIQPDAFDSLVTSSNFDYIIDAIDSVSPKIYLILAAKKHKIKIVSAMGAGGKLDPSKVLVRDISKTREDFLARVIRKRLKKHGIHKGVKCVFSTELQDAGSLQMTDNSGFKKSHYGTISYMPALFGLFAANVVIKHIIN